MSKLMKAAKLYGSQNIEIEQIPVPELANENDVLIKVLYCSICGSDMPKYFGHRVKKYPIVMGHEISGIALNGKHKDKLVAIKPKKFCEKCVNCKKSDFNLCLNIETVGSNLPGGFEEYIVVPDYLVLPIEKLSNNPILGTFIEPLAVGMHAISFCTSDSVAIVGNGSIGTSVLNALRFTKNMRDIDMFGRHDSAQIKHYNTVFECSGTVDGFNKAVQLCDYKGTIIQIGIIYPEYLTNELMSDKVMRKELKVVTSWDSNFTTDWDKSYNIIVNNPELFNNYATFTLDNIDKAFEYKRDNHKKVIIEVGKEV